MRFRFKSLRQSLIHFCFIMVCYFVSTAYSYDMEIKVNDMASGNGNSDLKIPIVMKTYSDSIVGFRITLESDHPGMLQFVGFDTSQTLSSDWEWLAVSYNGDSLQIEALANTIPAPITPGIGYPQNGDIPLIYLNTVLDTMHDSITLNQVSIDFIVDLYNFSFSNEGGNSIGISYLDPTIDTCWCDCTSWIYLPPNDSICSVWADMPIEEADTMIVDTVFYPFIDTSKVLVEGGTLFIQSVPDSCTIGDVDCTNIYNLLDITYLISYLYKDGPEPCFTVSYGDVNCDCTTNILDIVCLISYLYKGGSCSPCSCEEWQVNCGERK